MKEIPTPGPWNGSKGRVISESGLHVTDVFGYGALTERNHANARLIAAAPEMLEALRYAAETIKTARNYFPKSIRSSDTFRLLNAGVAIDKAIDKAEGKAP